jgi:hypothetical protein
MADIKKVASMFTTAAVSVTILSVLISIAVNWGAFSSRLGSVEAKASTCEIGLTKKLSIEEYATDMSEFKTDVREIKQDIKTILQRTAK